MNGAFDILLQKEKRGARVQATVTGKHYRRSLLVQGGLEVPCIVTATMPGSIMNHFTMAQYENLLVELYLEPKHGEKMGRSYPSSMRTISWEPTNVRRVRLRQAQKIKRRQKFDQETYLEKKNKRYDTVVTD